MQLPPFLDEPYLIHLPSSSFLYRRGDNKSGNLTQTSQPPRFFFFFFFSRNKSEADEANLAVSSHIQVL